jgi:predicted amidohydrolase
MILTLALAQIDITLGDKAANRARAWQCITQAATSRAHLLILPELWSTGYVLPQVEQLAEPIPHGPTARWLSQSAGQAQLWLTGSHLEATPQGNFNAAALYGPQGQIIGPYRKIHRFGPMHEDVWLSAGCTPGLFELPWGKTGIAICYDLRFPELFRHYALAGARLILLPSQWPRPRLHHWRTLVQARAIENQCFIVALNRSGRDAHNIFAGHSMVVGPWGDIIAEAGAEPELLMATIDLDEVEVARARIPILADRRPQCYTSP